MNLCIPFPRTQYLKKCIGYKGAKLWIELPSEIKNFDSIVRFNFLLVEISFNCRVNVIK